MSHISTRGYTRRDLESLYHHYNQSGVKSVTKELNANETEDILEFGDVTSKLSYQVSGTLVCDLGVSVNGTDFVNIATGVDLAAGIVSYTTHNIVKLKVSRVSGTGKLHIAAL